MFMSVHLIPGMSYAFKGYLCTLLLVFWNLSQSEPGCVKAACTSFVTGCALLKHFISQNCKIKKVQPWSNGIKKESCFPSALMLLYWQQGHFGVIVWVILCGVMRRSTMEETVNEHLKLEGFWGILTEFMGALCSGKHRTKRVEAAESKTCWLLLIPLCIQCMNMG